MKKSTLSLALILVISNSVFAKTGDKFNTQQSEPFSGKVLLEGLQSPWDMAIDRKGQLWVTELGGNILLVN